MAGGETKQLAACVPWGCYASAEAAKDALLSRTYIGLASIADRKSTRRYTTYRTLPDLPVNPLERATARRDVHAIPTRSATGDAISVKPVNI